MQRMGQRQNTEPTTTIGFRVTTKIANKINKVCKKRGITKSIFLDEAVIAYLSTIKD